jgi:hypothetical protein
VQAARRTAAQAQKPSQRQCAGLPPRRQRRCLRPRVRCPVRNRMVMRHGFLSGCDARAMRPGSSRHRLLLNTDYFGTLRRIPRGPERCRRAFRGGTTLTARQPIRGSCQPAVDPTAEQRVVALDLSTVPPDAAAVPSPKDASWRSFSGEAAARFPAARCLTYHYFGAGRDDGCAMPTPSNTTHEVDVVPLRSVTSTPSHFRARGGHGHAARARQTRD